jgi:hypothetical protein
MGIDRNGKKPGYERHSFVQHLQIKTEDWYHLTQIGFHTEPCLSRPYLPLSTSVGKGLAPWKSPANPGISLNSFCPHIQFALCLIQKPHFDRCCKTWRCTDGILINWVQGGLMMESGVLYQIYPLLCPRDSNCLKKNSWLPHIAWKYLGSTREVPGKYPGSTREVYSLLPPFS